VLFLFTEGRTGGTPLQTVWIFHLTDTFKFSFKVNQKSFHFIHVYTKC